MLLPVFTHAIYSCVHPQPAPPSAKKRIVDLSDDEEDLQSSAISINSDTDSPSAPRAHDDLDSRNAANNAGDDCQHLTPDNFPASLPVSGDGTKAAAAGAMVAAEASARNIKSTRVASRRGNCGEDEDMSKVDLGKGLEGVTTSGGKIVVHDNGAFTCSRRARESVLAEGFCMTDVAITFSGRTSAAYIALWFREIVSVLLLLLRVVY